MTDYSALDELFETISYIGGTPDPAMADEDEVVKATPSLDPDWHDVWATDAGMLAVSDAETAIRDVFNMMQALIPGRIVRELYREAPAHLKARTIAKANSALGDAVKRLVDLVVSDLDLGQLDELAVKLPYAWNDLVADESKRVISSVGLGQSWDEMFHRINERAMEWAEFHAADLIGKRWVNGRLVDNPNVAYRIDESTRDMLRTLITESFEAGYGIDDLQPILEQSYAFSDQRARIIARTEAINAANAGTEIGQRQAQAMGVRIEKTWIAAPDACGICLENAAFGAIELDEVFPSGHEKPTAHPNCRCTLGQKVDLAAMKAIKAYNPDQPRAPKGTATGGQWVESDYIYHATSRYRLFDIIDSGQLDVHGPDYGTDQDMWPDGSVEHRAYFLPTAEGTHIFAPEDGPMVVVRAKNRPGIRSESGTKDLYSTEPIPASDLEFQDENGSWKPVSEFEVTKAYNPDQPRDPRGTPTGGRWTDNRGRPSTFEIEFTPECQPEDVDRRLGPGASQKLSDMSSDIIGQLPVGYYDALIMYDDYDGVVRLAIRGSSWEGSRVYLSRAFRKDDKDGKLIVSHEEFTMGSRIQNKGIGAAVLKASLPYYDALGAKTIKLHANLSVGGYAWAKAGFVASAADVSYEKDRIGAFLYLAKPQDKGLLADVTSKTASWPREDFMYNLAGYSYHGEPWGKRALMQGGNWDGSLDLTNSTQRQRYEAFINKPPAPVATKASRGEMPIVFEHLAGKVPNPPYIDGMGYFFPDEPDVLAASIVLSKDDIDKAYNPDQRRHPKGTPVGGRWAPADGPPPSDPYKAPDEAAQAKSVEGIKQYLEFTADVHDRMLKEHGLISPDRFILDNGKAYPITDETFDGPRGQAKACYMNAGRMALSDEGATYVEGYVDVGIPIKHAWLVVNGKVVDPTLKPDGHVRGYFGVPFTTGYLRESIMDRKVWGLFQDHIDEGEELLLGGFVPDAVAKAAGGDWDESKHPRHPAGTSQGGEFAPADGSGAETPAETAKTATALFNEYDDPNATPENVFDSPYLRPDPERAKIACATAEMRNNQIPPTDQVFMKDGAWTPERKALHEKIIEHYLDKAARLPSNNGEPELIMIGGRGGSGKGWLTGPDGPIDKSRYIVIDADEIKGMLPGYDGWNAGRYHEESGYIFDCVVDSLRSARVNVVLDATLKTYGSAAKRVDAFAASGYKVSGYYMFSPRQEAAVNSINRFFKGVKDRHDRGLPTGRFVPPSYILDSKSNEASFDRLVSDGKFSSWSIYSTAGQTFNPPKLVSRSPNRRKAAMVQP